HDKRAGISSWPQRGSVLAPTSPLTICPTFVVNTSEGGLVASHPAATHLPARPARTNPDSGAGLKLLAVFLGLAVGAMIPIGIWLAASAQSAKDDARAAAAKSATAAAPAMAGMSAPASEVGAYATPSFAGIAPANADALATAHAAYPAALPAAPAGPAAHVRLSMRHAVLSIAPGIRYEAWVFGHTAPGPVIHVRQGQKVVVTLVNNGPMPHSVDFHAAQIAPNVAFSDVMPGKSKTFSFTASAPGVFMYHCGTAPAFMHIA